MHHLFNMYSYSQLLYTDKLIFSKRRLNAKVDTKYIDRSHGRHSSTINFPGNFI